MTTPSPRAARRARDCLLIVAAAGYGKSTALELEPLDEQVLYLSASEALSRLHALGSPAAWSSTGETPIARVLVDDVDRLNSAEQLILLRALGELPETVALTLASRKPLGRAARSALRRPVLDREAADLALSPETTAFVLRDEHGVDDAELANVVHGVTSGWPALVHLAGDALSRHRVEAPELVGALTTKGSAPAIWMQDQVLANLPRGVAHLLEALVDLGPVNHELAVLVCEAAGLGETSRTEESFRWLTRTGLLVPDLRPPGPWPRDLHRPVAVLAAFVEQARRPEAGTQNGARWRAATAWYTANALTLPAAQMCQKAGDSTAALALIRDHSVAMLAAGGAREIVRLIESRPVTERDEGLQLVLGDARRMAGDASGAARAFEPLIRRAGRPGTWPSALAWRVAMASYMRGDFPAALQACDAAAVSPTDEPDQAALGISVPDPTGPDRVRLHACRAGVLFLLGEVDESRTCARLALAEADQLGDDAAAAAAHIAAALGLTGAQREDHLRRAQAAAEAAGDLVQLARTLVNQTDELLEEARYPQALALGRRAVRIAERGSPPGLLTIALNNLGEALLWVGDFEEAQLFFDRSVRLSRRTGLRRAAAGLTGIADIAFIVGRREQSRMRYEEAIDLARGSGEAQVLVPALAGLARVLLDSSQPLVFEARAAADEAVAIATGQLLPQALVARGWVSVAEGDLPRARYHASTALALARGGRSAKLLAEALELSAATANSMEITRALLHEAAALWKDAGAQPASDRAHVLLGRLPGAGGPDRIAAREAGRRLVALGVQEVAGEPVLSSSRATAPLNVRVLGGFEVFVAGEPVPLTAWRSRQARTLVKLLVARRGRPVPRAELCETLWPDDESQRTAHRLSVLLSVVRTVLDPAKIYPTDHYLPADLTGVSIDLDHVSVDALDLVRTAEHAIQLARAGQEQDARELLAEVDARYRGDAFDDDPYDEWADAFREEVRATWIRTLRVSVDVNLRAGELDQSLATLVRLLAIDPYDESIHRAMVGALNGAGRYGEARRAFDRWVSAMKSIDAPTPKEAILGTARPEPLEPPRASPGRGPSNRTG